MRRPSSSNHRRAATAGPHLIYPHQRLFLSDHMFVLPRCDGFEDMFTKDMTEICFHWDDVVYISELTKCLHASKMTNILFLGGRAPAATPCYLACKAGWAAFRSQ
jgi:hypothetical protein